MRTSMNTGDETQSRGAETTDFETAQRRLFEAYGLEPRSRFVDIEKPRVRTHVLETGTAGGDTPLLFVHGTAAFGAFFAPLMGHLGDARMIAFDRPGYGLSDPFVYTKENLQRTVVDILKGILDALGIERVDLVGHSMGGHTGILFGLAHPDKVRRLFLVGSVPAFPGTRPPVPLRLLTVPGLNRLLRRLQKPGEEGVLDIAEIFGERETITDHPAFIRAIAAHEADPKAAEAGFSEFNALFSVRGWHPSVRIGKDELRDLQPPTTVIWGDHDTLGGPDNVRDAIELIPDVRFESVDAGHIPYLAHPEQCAQLIREGRGVDLSTK
ncbi:alpha/beta fold hydrolase [Halosimplex amylolyticum]|uniref:alpha/beta fold hydrolase n=1 Tax=Halosimplex amylolyticum TaxID=3396616 RepID=UPI003F548623